MLRAGADSLRLPDGAKHLFADCNMKVRRIQCTRRKFVTCATSGRAFASRATANDFADGGKQRVHVRAGVEKAGADAHGARFQRA